MHTLPNTPPTPLAPFSCFLTGSFVLFFLSGLLGGLPGSFSQRTPSPLPPTPCCEKRNKREARQIHGFLCVSTPVSKEPALNNSPPVDQLVKQEDM